MSNRPRGGIGPNEVSPNHPEVRPGFVSRYAGKLPNESLLLDRMKRFELFAQLPELTLRTLAATAREWVYHAGEYLWRQGESNHRVVFIEKGLAVTSRRVREGMHRIYGLYGPGDSMGIYAIWAGMSYPTDAQALNEGLRVIQLDTSAVIECAKHESQFSSSLLTEISKFTEAFMRKIDIVSAGTATQRIAKLMNVLVERYGVSKRENVAHLPFTLTLEQIGRTVDSRIETVARILSEWKRRGWVAFRADGIYIAGMDQLMVLLVEDGLRRNAYCPVNLSPGKIKK